MKEGEEGGGWLLLLLLCIPYLGRGAGMVVVLEDNWFYFQPRFLISKRIFLSVAR